MDGLFDTLNNKFNLQHNETMKSFQYYKFSRQSGTNAEEWMGRLRRVAEKTVIRELDRQ